VAPRPVGSVDMRTLPVLKSTATQKLSVGQDTPDKPPAPATLVTVHAAAPPVGLLEVTTVPPLPTATHSRTLGHETPFRLDAPIRLLSVHAVSLPVGFVEVITLPARFTPAHSVLLGHEMLLKA